MLAVFLQTVWAAPLPVHLEHALDELDAPELTAPAPPSERPDTDPSSWIYGYLPYWSEGIEDVSWTTMTHVAWFDVVLEAGGELGMVSAWEDNARQVVEKADAYGVKVHLTLSCFEPRIQEEVLLNRGLRNRVIEDLVDLVEEGGAHGVNIDFERLPGSLRSAFVDFVERVARRVDEVVVATPSVDWEGAYDLSRLAATSDALFLMGYNYYHSSGDPGPTAPLTGGNIWLPYSLAWSVEDHISQGVDPKKIVLGLPLYGHLWPTADTEVPGVSTGMASSISLAHAIRQAEEVGRKYDWESASPYALPTRTSQLWYDDPDSLMEKVRYARSESLAGVGFWALGYTRQDSPLWVSLENEFSQPAAGAGDYSFESANLLTDDEHAVSLRGCSSTPRPTGFAWAVFALLACWTRGRSGTTAT
ncbi:MAG: glycosyl hydrolase family 18 protein [Myxococcota bacterium]|nr:glycosyl hydrolase family 18 protein [Myxococcota bacterium]